MSVGKRPKVSVLMITYNHERFVEQAVRSVMMQKANFDWELVIGEDCSTDRTREIIERLVEEFSSGRIRLLANEQNLGVGANFRRTYEACRGEYVAFLEGDDYWTAEEKLQLQADFLDAHPDVSLCFHPMMKYSEAEQRILGIGMAGKPGRQFYDFTDVLNQVVHPHISTMMVRKKSLNLPATIDSIVNVDTALHFFCAERGRLGYIDRPMSVYRQQEGSVWFGGDKIWKIQSHIRLYLYMNNLYQGKYARKFEIERKRLFLALTYSQYHQFQAARKAALDALIANDGGHLGLKDRTIALGLIFFPRGINFIRNVRSRLRRLKTPRILHS
jgi:glycosyltransferase involved in cell wall biosynthesis